MVSGLYVATCSAIHWRDRTSEGQARREVSAAFHAGNITSEGGGLLLREVEQRFGKTKHGLIQVWNQNIPELSKDETGLSK